MEEKLNELTNIIYKLDELLDHWFDGDNANLLAAGGYDVFTESDNLRNRAIEIINELKNNN